jgi:hypothetical protein
MPHISIIPFDRLVWIRLNSNSNNNDNISDNNHHYWRPAVYCASHSQAMIDFQDRMTQHLQMQACVKTSHEKRSNTSIPVVVPVTGRDCPVVRLEAAVDENLRHDFSESSHLIEFSEQYEHNQNDDAAYEACLQELEELIQEALCPIHYALVEDDDSDDGDDGGGGGMKIGRLH